MLEIVYPSWGISIPTAGRQMCVSFLFFFAFFRLPAVHVTQLGMNVPIISEDIGATVS